MYIFYQSNSQMTPLKHKALYALCCPIVYIGEDIGIDTKIEVIVVSPTTWEAHHSPTAKPECCGELPRSLVTPQWPKSRYHFLFYHDASKQIEFMQFPVCISRKVLIKLLQISHYGKHGHRPLSQQLPWLRLGYHCDVTVVPVSLNLDNMPQSKTSKSNKIFVWNIEQGKTDETFYKDNTWKLYIDYKM